MDNLFISSGIPLKKLEKHFNVVPKNKFYCEVSDGEYTAIGVLNDEGNSDILTGFGLHNEEKLAFILKKFIKVFPVILLMNVTAILKSCFIRKLLMILILINLGLLL